MSPRIGWRRQSRRLVSRASGPRSEGGAPSTQRGQDGRDTITGRLAPAAIRKYEISDHDPYDGSCAASSRAGRPACRGSLVRLSRAAARGHRRPAATTCKRRDLERNRNGEPAAAPSEHVRGGVHAMPWPPGQFLRRGVREVKRRGAGPGHAREELKNSGGCPLVGPG